MGHGGAGSPSMKGSAWGTGKFAKDRMSSGVGKVSTSPVFSFVGFDVSVVGAAAGWLGADLAEKCFLRYF